MAHREVAVEAKRIDAFNPNQRPADLVFVLFWTIGPEERSRCFKSHVMCAGLGKLGGRIVSLPGKMAMVSPEIAAARAHCIIQFCVIGCQHQLWRVHLS